MAYVLEHVRNHGCIAGDTKERLVFCSGQDAFRQLCNRLRLVAGGLVIGDKLEHVPKLEPQPASVNAGFFSGMTRLKFGVPPLGSPKAA